MLIQLIDRNQGMYDAWQARFDGIPNIVIHCGDFFSLPTDCIVSPANSFGYMDGGLDLLISQRLGWGVQNKLQQVIRNKYYGELLVGQAELIETEDKDIPFCISAPTMRVPLIITETVNAYLAARAIFLLIKNNMQIKTITMSGLGTGVGKLSYGICAMQMKRAYDEVYTLTGTKSFPSSWHTAQWDHNAMAFGRIK